MRITITATPKRTRRRALTLVRVTSGDETSQQAIVERGPAGQREEAPAPRGGGGRQRGR